MAQATEEKSRFTFTNLSVRRETSLALFTIAVIIGVTLHSPRFLSFGNFHSIFLDSAIVAIAAIGQMMVVMTGGIDLSIGSGLALSGMLVGLIYKAGIALNPYLALLLGGIIGLGLGGINGVLVVNGKIPPIIATLGTMSIYRGLIFLVSDGQWVSAHEMPSNFIHLARGTILGIPNLLFIAGLLYIIFYFLLSHSKTGREVYAVGGNLEAAKVAGINTNKINYIVYSLTGFLYGLCGVLWVSRFASAQPDTATGFEFSTVTAIVLGGVSVIGGTGRVSGVLLGALLISIIENALNVTQTNPFWKLAIQGIVILVAVSMDGIVRRRQRTKVVREEQS